MIEWPDNVIWMNLFRKVQCQRIAYWKQPELRLKTTSVVHLMNMAKATSLVANGMCLFLFRFFFFFVFPKTIVQHVRKCSKCSISTKHFFYLHSALYIFGFYPFKIGAIRTVKLSKRSTEWIMYNCYFAIRLARNRIVFVHFAKCYFGAHSFCHFALMRYRCFCKVCRLRDAENASF